MAYIDTDKILYGSPKKKLIIGFDNLKKNFNESNAKEYSELYKNQSLGFILENSRLIFSEPFYGYEFYSDILTGDEEMCAFPKYEVELDKINTFIDENRDNMSDEQLKMYTDLRDKLIQKMKDCRNTRVIAQQIDDKTKDIDDKTSDKISNALFDYKRGLVDNDDNRCNKAKSEIAEVITDKPTAITYGPYVSKVMTDSGVAGVTVKKINGPEDMTPATRINESVLVKKLYADKAYQEAVKAIPSRMDRIVYTELANEDVIKQLDEIITERVSDIETYYASSNSAVNNIFNDAIYTEAFEEEYEQYRHEKYGIRLNVFEYMRDIITTEYQISEDTSDVITGFDIFDEGTTIEDAFRIINELCEDTAKFAGVYTEKPVADDEDVSDEDIDNMDNEINGTSSKKPEAPKPKNLANSVQFKAMDAEVKQNKQRAAAKQKGQEIKNAAKAVAQLPKNISDDIKEQIAKIDKADDERRMKYMSEPGFRKKAVRNLRLSLLYGGAASASLALVPVVTICRHFSKKKDARIRNQLVRDIETEIKITDEKINDASSNGDNAEKYKLMRIKSQLEAERVRVRLNSKYV